MRATTIHTSKGSWRGEALVVGLLLALIGGAYFSLRWYGFDLLEEGYFLANARRVQLGGLPYRDFDTPYTPGVFYLYAWLMEWLGPNVAALRSLQIVGRLVAVGALYVAGRQVMPPFFAAIPPALILAMDTAPELWGLHPGWYSTPASLLMVLAVVAYLRTGRAGWLVAAGMAGGIGFAFKQNLPAYGLMATLWLLVVCERHLAPVRLPLPIAGGGRRLWRIARIPPPVDKERDPLDHHLHALAGGRHERLVGAAALARGAVQAAALLLLPVTGAALVRQYWSPLVGALFVAPLAATSLAGAWLAYVARRPRGGGGRPPAAWSAPPAVGHDRGAEEGGIRALSFFLRPALVLLGFGLVTAPWLLVLARALDGRMELLGPIVGQIDLAGYFFGMAPPAWDHVRLVAMLLLLPLAPLALGAAGLWSRRGVALGLAALVALMAARLAQPAGDGEPWHVIRAAAGLPAQAGAAWQRLGEEARPTDNLVLYLPWLAFWPALLWLMAREWRGSRAGVPWPAAGASPGRTRALIRLWYLAAGATLFLNQYPRMDEIHWLWSAGMLLVAGADLLAAAYRWALRLAPALRSATGQAALGLSLLALPLAAVLPHTWWRVQAWSYLVPAPGGPPPQAIDGHTAAPAENGRLVALPLPGDGGRLRAPAADVRAIQEVVALLQQKTAPGEPIFAYPAIPGFYFLADRPNATRFNHLFRGMASPAEQEAMVRQLERVRYVVWDDGGARFWVQPGDNAPVTEYIRTHFRIERLIGPYAVLVRAAEADGWALELPYYLPAGRSS